MNIVHAINAYMWLTILTVACVVTTCNISNTNRILERRITDLEAAALLQAKNSELLVESALSMHALLKEVAEAKKR